MNHFLEFTVLRSEVEFFIIRSSCDDNGVHERNNNDGLLRYLHIDRLCTCKQFTVMMDSLMAQS